MSFFSIRVKGVLTKRISVRCEFLHEKLILALKFTELNRNGGIL